MKNNNKKQNKTQITLLHLPNQYWKLFRNVVMDLDTELIAYVRKSFDSNFFTLLVGVYYMFNKDVKAYLIHKTDAGIYKICRVLNEYNSEEEATKDLVGLLTDEKTERQLLKEFSKKSII